MEKIKLVFRNIIFYIIGYIAFYLICIFTAIVVMKLTGAKNIYELTIEMCNNYFFIITIIYTILFIMVILLIHIYDLISIKKLNKKLKKLRRG